MTKIQWTNETWNPFAGCSKVSAGCKNCYAIRDAVRLSENNNPKIANKYAGTVNGNNWTGKINLAPEDTLLKPLRWTRPRMIFVNSMSDLFHENVPEEWIDKVFAIMALSPNHTFQILTKRPERMRDYLLKKGEEFSDYGISETIKFTDLEGLIFDYIYEKGSLKKHLIDAGWFYDTDYYEGGSEPGDLIYEYDNPLHNVWLGVSIEDQKTADERIPLLLQTPAAVRWISAEPLLGEVDLFNVDGNISKSMKEDSTLYPADLIDWVVVGGESGDNSRVCNIEWIRSIVRQCQVANVPVFVKQLGAKPFHDGMVLPFAIKHLEYSSQENKTFYYPKHKKGGDIEEFPNDLRFRQFPGEGEK